MGEQSNNARTLTSLHGETDPMRWAANFMDVFGVLDDKVDSGTMVAWFANAMEAARMDERRKEAPPVADMVRREKVLLETGRLEGMASMLRVAGENQDNAKVAEELEAMAKRLRGEGVRERRIAPEVAEALGMDGAGGITLMEREQ